MYASHNVNESSEKQNSTHDLSERAEDVFFSFIAGIAEVIPCVYHHQCLIGIEIFVRFVSFST